jgi:nitroreductase
MSDLARNDRGLSSWQFVVVMDKKLLKGLSEAKQRGAAFLKNAPLGIVVCGEPHKSDVWIEDAAIASMFVHLAAWSLGLGSCWIQIRNRMHGRRKTAESYVRELLSIPDDLTVESIVAVGYPAESKPPHGRNELQYEKVHCDAFGQSYVASPSAEN